MRTISAAPKIPALTALALMASMTTILAGTAPSRAEDVAAQPVRIAPPVEDGKALFSGGSIARIVGLRKGGDGFVSVRAAPSTKATELDRLTASRLVIALSPPTDWSRATFIGVVYPVVADGGVSLFEACDFPETPPGPPFDRIYTGPCRSGWVHRRFVEVLAD